MIAFRMHFGAMKRAHFDGNGRFELSRGCGRDPFEVADDGSGSHLQELDNAVYHVLFDWCLLVGGANEP